MVQQMTSGNSIVDSIGNVDFAGNIIPMSWYQEILLDNGHVDLNAIVILADIAYWYRPSVKYDEKNAQKVIKKKFKGDLLQRSYTQIKERLNLTVDQSRKAIKRLENNGFIKRHFRDEIHNGTMCANIMYIELMPDRIRDITYPIDADGGVSVNMQAPIGIKTDNPTQIDREVRVSEQISIGTDTDTNTKNTTKIITKDYPSTNQVREAFKQQINYSELLIDLPLKQNLIDDIVDVATEVLSSAKPELKVNKEDRPIDFVKERFRRLNIESIKYVISSLNEYSGGVSNTRGYMISTLFNAPVTMDAYYGFKVNQDMVRM